MSLPVNSHAIYQNSDTTLTFSATLAFDGAKLAGDSKLQVSFEFFLSDRNDVTPSALNGRTPLRVADVTRTHLSDATREELSGDLVDEAEYNVSGMTEVYVPSDSCATSDRFLCVHYMMLRTATVAFRDSDSSNDFQCADISSKLKCTNGKRVIS